MAMSTSSGSADYGLFDELAEEFAERYRRGERPSLQEYVDRCPEMGDEIRELFPALVEVEQAEEVLEPQREPAASSAAPVLRQVGDYRVIREVGRGGMGVVYEAEQVSLGRRVALKILPGVVAKDRKALERFRREARAAARLHHTNIVPVFEVGQDGEVVFYAMQFIQGQGLEVVIDELAHQRQRSGQGSAAPVAAAAEEQKPGRPGTTRPDLTGALSRSLASLPVRDRNEALTASLRARQVSRMARSLVAGTFVAEQLDPDRTGSSGGVSVTTPGDSQPKDPTGWSTPASASSSAMLPGGTQVSAVESSGKRLPFFRSVAQIGRQAAQGLAYAHARGIIHRDIKPSNLLLDSVGVVWIADFGLAKADDDGLTATGDILGTIRYMAPERFRGEGDLRADVYALGLTLYELLTLRPGFESSDRLQMIERIKAEEPVRPRLLDSRIPRDLETIVLKAIDKDPGRRYATADAMGEDLRRYLDDEPVLARRTTALERYARWARHNPGVAVLGAVLTAVLLMVTAGSLIVAGNMRRLAIERGEAAREAELARRHEVDQRDLAEKAQRQAQASTREAEAQRQRAEASFARARRAVDDSFTKVSESKLLDVPGLQPLRLDLLKSALAFYDEFLKERAGDAALQADLLQTRLRTGRILNTLGRNDDARASFQAAAEGYEQALRARPADLDLKAGLADALFSVATYHASQDARIQAFRRPIALLEEVVATRPGEVRFKKTLANYYNSIGAEASAARNRTERSDAYERCVTLWLELAEQTPHDPDIFQGLSLSLNNLAFSAGFRGSAAQRMRLLRQAVEFERAVLRVHPNDAAALSRHSGLTGNLASALWAQGNRQGAVEELRGVIALLEQKARANPEVSGLLSGYQEAARGLAYYLKEWDRRDDAVGVLRQAFAVAETLARENPGAVVAQKNFLATAYSVADGLKDLKRPDEAIRCLMTGRAALDRIPRETGDSLVEDATNRLAFAALMAQCKPELAADERAAREGLLDQAMASLRRAAAAGWRDAAKLKSDAIYSTIRGRPDYPSLLAAVETSSKATAPVAASAGPANLDRSKPAAGAVVQPTETRLARARVLAAIGQIQAMAGRNEKGLEYLRQALSVQQRLVAEQPADAAWREELAGIQLSLGWALTNLGQADSAIEALEAARALYEALGDVSQEKARFRTERVATCETLGRAYSQAERQDDSAAAWDRAQAELTQAIGEKPEDPQRRINRASHFIRRRQEPLAASDLWHAVSMDPAADSWSRPVMWASLVLFSGDQEEYRRGCRRLLERFGQTSDNVCRLYLAITLGLGEDAVDDLSHVVRLTEEVIQETGRDAAYLHDLALVYLRAGRFEAALRALDDSDRTGSWWPALSLNNPVRAIVCHHLGRNAEARAALEKARQWAVRNEKKGPPDLPDFHSVGENYRLDLVGDWYRHLILLREAEALIVYDPIFPADPFAH